MCDIKVELKSVFRKPRISSKDGNIYCRIPYFIEGDNNASETLYITYRYNKKLDKSEMAELPENEDNIEDLFVEIEDLIKHRESEEEIENVNDVIILISFEVLKLLEIKISKDILRLF